MISRSLLCLCLAAAGVAAPRVNFDRDVRPILSDHCFTCHGPDEKQRMAGLRLDTQEGVETVAKTRLLARLTHAKPALRMPPPSTGRTLTDKQIGVIRQWIEEGAGWQQHWAYLPPRRSELPPVKNARWVRNPIDHLILARLEREGLKPMPEAGRGTLLRRVTLDLTGLPPTPAEVAAFLKDRSPNAYDKAVDRLLASPRYGERMALQWLDLARYADTHGYHIDSHRDMWPWRDWVIRAFNRNQPYDQFTLEQLAGDLLANPTLDQRIATGFNRNHMVNYEGGAIPEEYQNEYVVDRVETTALVWLGMTMGCARCHDHKYDPITQKDFYRFYAFFNNVSEKGLDGREGNAVPMLPLPNPEQEAEMERIKEELCRLEDTLHESRIQPLMAAWEKAAELPGAPPDGLVAHWEFDNNLADTSGRYLHGKPLRGELAFANGMVHRAADFNGDTHVALGRVAQASALAVWLKYSGTKRMAVLEGQGFELGFEDSFAIGDLKRGAHLYGNGFRSEAPLVQGVWYHLALSGGAVYLNGKRVGAAGFVLPAGPLAIRKYKGQIDDLRLYNRALPPGEIEALAIHLPARAGIETLKRNKEQEERLREYFLTYAAPAPLRQAQAELIEFKEQQKRLSRMIPTVMVMDEMLQPRATHVLGRGDYRNKGEEVTPGVPSVLPPLPAGAPLNRLTLARWLLDPSHPLTARVAVNRFWQMYFGHGIVKTAEDFGSQGEAPVHAELLDWLATEFMRSGWDVKAMQRLIVTSAAYRQSSRGTPALIEKDPENRLLARGPRFRLSAESVRDNALYIAGLLNEEMYGPAVYPYQPAGVWEDIAYGDVFSAQTYAPSRGKDLYRRSMYTFWKRTAPPPALATFDAPDREKCTARRPLTNTPLQALALMNDPTYVEASRALAERMLLEGGAHTAARLRYGFERAAARQPSSREVKVLAGLVAKREAAYRRDRAAARKLLAVGESGFSPKLDASELAAWTTVASVILNLDEVISKE